MKQLFTCLMMIWTLQSNLLAQLPINNQENPCKAKFINNSSGNLYFRTAVQNFISPNFYLPCGAGTTEDNPVWWKFKTLGNKATFKITTTKCIAGSADKGTQLTLWTAANCNVNPRYDTCHTFYEGILVVTYSTSPDSLYFWQFDGIGEAQCSFDVMFNPAEFQSIVATNDKQENSLKMKVLNNLSEDKITVLLPIIAQKTEISLFNSQGQKVLSENNFSILDERYIEIPVAHLPKGIYIIEAVLDGKRIVEKFLKE